MVSELYVSYFCCTFFRLPSRQSLQRLVFYILKLQVWKSKQFNIAVFNCQEIGRYIFYHHQSEKISSNFCETGKKKKKKNAKIYFSSILPMRNIDLQDTVQVFSFCLCLRQDDWLSQSAVKGMLGSCGDVLRTFLSPVK